MTTLRERLTLDRWLKRYPTLVPVRSGARVGVHDVADIAHTRTYLWDLADYRVESVSGGVVWLAPREVAAVADEPTNTPPLPRDSYYQPTTGAKCGCRPGVVRDNCPTCEGTGWKIDFAAIRARRARGGA